MSKTRSKAASRVLEELAGADVKALRRALLDHGSETPDNKAAVSRLTRSRGSWRVGKLSLQDVVYEIESCDRKALRALLETRRRRPTPEELEAALRVLVLILTATSGSEE